MQTVYENVVVVMDHRRNKVTTISCDPECTDIESFLIDLGYDLDDLSWMWCDKLDINHLNTIDTTNFKKLEKESYYNYIYGTIDNQTFLVEYSDEYPTIFVYTCEYKDGKLYVDKKLGATDKDILEEPGLYDLDPDFC